VFSIAAKGDDQKGKGAPLSQNRKLAGSLTKQERCFYIGGQFLEGASV
jgi:hypothetical protein